MLLLMSVLVTLCTFVMQTHPVFRSISPGGHIDLALLVVVGFTLLWGGHRALWFGFVIGLVHDALSSQWLGLNALSKSIVVFIVLNLSRNVQQQSPVVQSLFAAAAIGLDTTIRLFMLAVLQSQIVPLAAVLHTLLPHLLLGLILMPGICAGLRLLAHILRVLPEKGQGNAAV
ncbi:MAG: rod shape-determining protein MreD [Candidatus Tectomicrobia bacterium]|nr:rod shape-determining protein MreD [Candidatus Tectomicrobia bacterium]